MDQYRIRAVREYFDGFTAEDDHGDAVAAVQAMTIRSQPFASAVSMITW